jgi:hypothetical protein
VRQRFGARQIVDRDEIDVLVAHRRAHDVSADTAESVYSDLHRHRGSFSGDDVAGANE